MRENMESDLIISFDDSSRELILQLLSIQKNEKSELIDQGGKVLTNQEFEPIKSEEFGGILRSSKIPIKKNKLELIRYFVNRQG